jgi:hypothetical protein
LLVEKERVAVQCGGLMFYPFVLALKNITQFFDRGSVLTEVAKALDLGVMLPNNSKNVVYINIKWLYATGGNQAA